MVPPLRRLISIAYAVQAPVSSRTDHEVDGEPADDAVLGEARRRPCALCGSWRGVRRVGREDAAEVTLAAAPAEHLVVRRQQLDRPVREHPQLDAGAASSSPTMRSSTMPPSCSNLARYDSLVGRSRLELHPSTLAATAARSSADPGAGRWFRSTSALPAPDTPSLSLMIALVMVARADGACRPRPSTTSSTLCRSSRPSGCRTPSSSKSRRHPDLLPSARSWGPRRRAGCPGDRHVALGLSRGVRDQVTQRAIGDELTIRRRMFGRCRSFSLSGPDDASPTETICSRERAC